MILDADGKKQIRATNFFKQIISYHKAKQEGDLEKAKLHLNYARWELKYHSNSKKYPELDKRYYSGEVLLDTYNDPLLTEKEILAKLKILEDKSKIKELSATEQLQVERTAESRVDGFIAEVKNKISTLVSKDIIDEKDMKRMASFLYAQLSGKGYSVRWEINAILHKKMYYSGCYSKKYKIGQSEIVDNAWDRHLLDELAQHPKAESFIGSLKCKVDSFLGENKVFSRKTIRDIFHKVQAYIEGKEYSTCWNIESYLIKRMSFLGFSQTPSLFIEYKRQLKAAIEDAWNKSATKEKS